MKLKLQFKSQITVQATVPWSTSPSVGGIPCMTTRMSYTVHCVVIFIFYNPAFMAHPLVLIKAVAGHLYVTPTKIPGGQSQMKAVNTR